MSNYELPLTISVSLQRGSEIRGDPNQQNRRRHLMEQALLYAMRSQSASCPPLQQAIVRRSRPAQYGEDRFGPPTLERNGSEHRRAVSFSLFGHERGLVRDLELSLQERPISQTSHMPLYTYQDFRCRIFLLSFSRHASLPVPPCNERDYLGHPCHNHYLLNDG